MSVFCPASKEAIFLLSGFKIGYCYSDTFWYFYFLADSVWGCNTIPWSPAGISAHCGKLLIINILSALSNKPFWDSLADWHKLLLAPRCTWVSRPAWHRSSVRGGGPLTEQWWPWGTHLGTSTVSILHSSTGSRSHSSLGVEIRTLRVSSLHF